MHSAEDCRTEFLSGGHQKEYALIKKWKDLVCSPRGWLVRNPDGQSLAFDQLLSRDGGTTWTSVQLKSVSARKVTSGYRGKLVKCAGVFDGKKKSRPYSIGDANEYVFLYHNEAEQHIDVWSFHETELDGRRYRTRHISSSRGVGTGYITLHLPISMLKSSDAIPCTKIIGDGGSVSPSLWTRGNHGRFEC